MILHTGAAASFPLGPSGPLKLCGPIWPIRPGDDDDDDYNDDDGDDDDGHRPCGPIGCIDPLAATGPAGQ
eukprot:5796033-Karenia_brevis.AAC.1